MEQLVTWGLCFVYHVYVLSVMRLHNGCGIQSLFPILHLEGHSLTPTAAAITHPLQVVNSPFTLSLVHSFTERQLGRPWMYLPRNGARFILAALPVF